MFENRNCDLGLNGCRPAGESNKHKSETSTHISKVSRILTEIGSKVNETCTPFSTYVYMRRHLSECKTYPSSDRNYTSF